MGHSTKKKPPKNLLFILKIIIGTSLVVQWLRLQTSIAGGMGSIPGLGIKIPHAIWHGQKKRKNHYLNLYCVLHVPGSNMVREPPNRPLSC